MRALLWFWVALGLILGSGALVLQGVGPPGEPGPLAAALGVGPRAAPESPAGSDLAHEPPERADPAAVARAPSAERDSAGATTPTQPLAASGSDAHVPPTPKPDASRNEAAAVAGAAPVAPRVGEQSVPQPPPAARPGRFDANPIANPDSAMLEPLAGMPDAALPRIAPDGRAPMQVYARNFNPADARPRLAILVAGVGLNASDSDDAIRVLPGGVTLAFSPYALHPEALVRAARAAGHETVISLPLEGQRRPGEDAGDHALLAGAPAEQNERRLAWALSRIRGYAGATGALGAVRGERFAADETAMRPVLQELADRGLYFVDARPGAPLQPMVWGRSVDVVLDEPAVGREIETKLAQLEQIGRAKGSALGFAGAVRPVTVGRLTNWARDVGDRGFALAPVSALVRKAP